MCHKVFWYPFYTQCADAPTGSLYLQPRNKQVPSVSSDVVPGSGPEIPSQLTCPAGHGHGISLVTTCIGSHLSPRARWHFKRLWMSTEICPTEFPSFKTSHGHVNFTSILPTKGMEPHLFPIIIVFAPPSQKRATKDRLWLLGLLLRMQMLQSRSFGCMQVNHHESLTALHLFKQLLEGMFSMYWNF